MTREYSLEESALPALASLFSPVVINDLVESRKSRYFSEIIANSNISKNIYSETISHFFEWLHDNLIKSYRNEYVYKNAITNKILLGRHSLNTSYMLTEFRAANCKADVVILNGTSTVYEIKTDYDSLDRLDNQIAAYSSVFDLVNVVTSESQAERIDRVIAKNIGLIVLTERYTLKTIRNPISGKTQVKPSVIFDSLRKNEYLSIVREYFDFEPNVPNTQIYSECKKLFSAIPPEIVHDLMVKTLKRRDQKRFMGFLDSVPKSLKTLALGSPNDEGYANRFCEILSCKMNKIHA